MFLLNDKNTLYIFITRIIKKVVICITYERQYDEPCNTFVSRCCLQSHRRYNVYLLVGTTIDVKGNIENFQSITLNRFRLLDDNNLHNKK